MAVYPSVKALLSIELGPPLDGEISTRRFMQQVCRRSKIG
jgi:hypothetical protein